MTTSYEFISERFPRSSRYHPAWIQAGASGGANALRLTEWLAEAMDLRPGMRVLDLGCGRAMSSIFLHREFGVQVWATDLWFNPSENLQRIRDAEADQGVFPIQANARSLPFAAEFFDAAVSIDSFLYYGTDDRFLNDLARLVRPEGQIGIAQVGLLKEFPDAVPDHLQAWWQQDQLWCLHSADWWRQHWSRTGLVDIEQANALPDGGREWLEWLRLMSPEESPEAVALEADAGRHLGYIRVVGRRRPNLHLPEPITSIPPAPYTKTPLLRDPMQA